MPLTGHPSSGHSVTGRFILMDQLQTEARNPASTNLDELSTLQFVRLMCAEDAKVPAAVASQIGSIAQAIDVIADRLRGGGRLIYAGAGTSGRLGVLDATECPPTFNAPPEQVIGLIAGGPSALTQAVEGAEDHPEFAARDMLGVELSSSDVVVGIATSGRTPYVLAALICAREKGAFTVGLSCNPDSELIAHADLAITPVVGPEVLSGSTRLKAGTATKLVLNMLTTGAMVQLGKTYGNLMVDLRATNEKLRVRTNRIVREATGLDRPSADALLDRCNRELKTALVSQLAHVSAEEARERLRVANGRVRAAIATPSRNGKPADPDNLLLGIDGGGTRTVALLATPGNNGCWTTLGRGEAGPSNQKVVGIDSALAALEAAVADAFAAAGMTRRDVDAACLGLAGAGRPDDQAVILDWARRHKLAGTVDVIEDAALLPAAGTPQGWGVAVIAGTGSMAYGKAPDGRTARAGGWGHVLGDEGSGYAIAVAGLRAAARAADGRGPTTPLTSRLLAVYGLARAEELISVVYPGCDRPSIAALAPIVLDSADTDPVANDIVTHAAGELAAAVAAVTRSLRLGCEFPVALAGGLLVSSAGYRKRFIHALTACGLCADPLAVVREPAEGALRLALARARSLAS